MITVAVAIRAADDAGHGIGRQQAGDIRIFTPTLHWMERGIGRIERGPRVEVADLTADRQRADHIVIAVAMAFEAYLVEKVGRRDGLAGCGYAGDPGGGA